MHNLIVGASYSGKSFLAKRLALQAEMRGEKIVVFDPLKSNGWPESSILYAKPDVFINEVWDYESCHVFVDEAKVLFEAERLGAEKLSYQGRHGGRLVYFIGQRAMSMIPPNARNQCGKVFAFKQSAKDCVTLADEYHEIFMGCKKLPQIHFYCSDGFTALKGNLDFSAGTIPHINLEEV